MKIDWLLVSAAVIGLILGAVTADWDRADLGSGLTFDPCTGNVGTGFDL